MTSTQMCTTITWLFSMINIIRQGSTNCLLTPWCRVLLEQLTGLQLVKKFPAFHGTQRFITALTSFRHMSLSWVSPIQSIFPLPTSWRSILILSTHLRLGLPSGLFPFGFPTKTLYTPLSSPIRATCPAKGIYIYAKTFDQGKTLPCYFLEQHVLSILRIFSLVRRHTALIKTCNL